MLEQVPVGLGGDDPEVHRDPVVGRDPGAALPRGAPGLPPGGGRAAPAPGPRGSVAVAIRSMSWQVSVLRRAEPATSTASLAGSARRSDASCSAIGSTSESSSRSAGPRSASLPSAASTFSSALGPSPLISRIRSCSAAARRSSRLETPSSSWRRRAVFAPTPGTRVTSTRAGGNFRFSFAAAGISPVSSSARIFCSSVSPTPGSSVARPARASSSTETGLWRIDASGLAIGQDAVSDRPIELVQRRQLGQRLGDLGVPHPPMHSSAGRPGIAMRPTTIFCIALASAERGRSPRYGPTMESRRLNSEPSGGEK